MLTYLITIFILSGIVAFVLGWAVSRAYEEDGIPESEKQEPTGLCEEQLEELEQAGVDVKKVNRAAGCGLFTGLVLGALIAGWLLFP